MRLAGMFKVEILRRDANRLSQNALSELIRSLSCDLVLCGNEAIDGCTGQVGPIIAGNLGFTQFTYVREMVVSGGEIAVQREVGRNIEQYRASLPAVVCVLKGINHPRPCSPADKTPRTVSAADCRLDPERIGNDGSPTRVVKVVMSSARAKTYVDIDDSLPWDERIRMIINGKNNWRRQNWWRSNPPAVPRASCFSDAF